MPEGSSQYIYLQNKRFRALSYNWDILSTYGETTRLYCLTDFQVAWLLSNTEYMRWSTRWENCPCTQADLDALKAEMEFNLMSCIDLQPYQLQTLFNNAQNALLSEYESLWDGVNPSSVNPDAPDDFFDGDGSPDREDALCTALTLWAYSYAVEWIDKASIILGIASAVSTLVDFLIPVGGNIAVKVIKDLTNPIQQQVDALNNLTILDAVICDWRDQLEGTVINASNWTNAVQGLVYPIQSDLWYIQQLFAADTQILANFLSFVNSLGEGYELAQLGASICACGGWTFTCDFTIQDCNFVPFADVPPFDGNNGVWVNGVGWDTTDVEQFTDGWARTTSPQHDIALTFIDTVEFTFNYQQGSWDFINEIAVGVFGYVNNTLVYIATRPYTNQPDGNGQVFSVSPSQNLDRIRLITRCSTASPSPATLTGSTEITSVTITGQGTNPF